MDPTQTDSISTPRLIVYGVFAIIVVILAIGQIGSGGGGGAPAAPTPASATEWCEASWATYKDNASNALRTRAEYMTNCVSTQNALNQATRDHR